LKREKMIGDQSDERGTLTQDSARESHRLVWAIANGDSDAEQALVLRYGKPVRAMLLARSRNPDLTADLFQDVMIEAICALRRGQLREPAKLTQFIVGIARNLLNNHFRSSIRRPESLELPDNLPDLSNSMEVQKEHDRESRAMNAISTLEPLDKAILQMTLVEGLKPGIIAQRLNLNPDVVRQRKLRAIRRVTEIVREESQTGSSGHIVVGRVT